MEQVELATGAWVKLVERAAPARSLPLRPAGRVRGELLPSLGRAQHGSVKPNRRASTIPRTIQFAGTRRSIPAERFEESLEFAVT
jgi:hypothetical protein